MPFLEDIKNIFKDKNNGLMRIIFINIALFILVNLIIEIGKVSGYNSADVLTWLALSSNLSIYLSHFWTLITYMFLHTELMHILFNMLWLYWMGKIFTEYLGSKRLVVTYLMGGICGGILFVLLYNFVPALRESNFLLGASAGVMAIVVAIAVLIPDYVIQLLFFGPVKIKYVALVSFVTTTVLDFSQNTGGKIAHLGGALYGLLYIIQYKKGTDWSKGPISLLDKLTSLFKKEKKSKMKVAYKRSVSDEEYNANKLNNQRVIDDILDKISRSGYESLSKKEKDILFKMSNKEK